MMRACCLWVQRLKNIVIYKCSHFEQHKHNLAIKFNIRKHCCTFKHRDFSPLTLLFFLQSQGNKDLTTLTGTQKRYIPSLNFYVS